MPPIDTGNLVVLAPFIYNRRNFYFRDHPNYHPDTTQYMAYWETHEKRAIEGFWGLDQDEETDQYNPSKEGGWRFMTPQHYWYTNFCFIQHLPDKNAPPTTIMPDCRDIDWYWFYIFIMASGFSGFEGDKEISCHRLVDRYEKSKDPRNPLTFDLTPKDNMLWKSIQPNVLKDDGTYKKYMDPIEYLNQTFDEPLGRIVYENGMDNIADVESRGSGKSYRMMGVLSQAFNFFGARTFEQYLATKKGPTICVGSALSSKSGALLKKYEFSQNELINNFGNWETEDAFIPGFFHKETSGVMSSGNEKNPYRHQYKVSKRGTWQKQGTWTNIVHQSYDGNPEAFVGNRSILMLEDEFGLNGNALKCAHADNTVMKMSGVKMGIALKSGTGGNVLKIQQAKEIFYNPDDYGYIRLEDKWENSAGGVGMFVPAYYVDSSFRDKNGNQDIVRAYDQEMHNRNKLTEGNSLAMLDGYIIDHPLVPSEMFLSPETNIFPVTLLREHKARLEAKRVFEKITSVGDLEYNDKSETSVKWVQGYDRYRAPIKSYDLKAYDGNIGGSIVIYEHPVDNIPDPKTNRSLYKIGYDPVRDDGGGTSLAAIKVYKGYTEGNWNEGIQDNIVAEYYGRLDNVEDMHEICIKLCIYYNCKVLPETNIPDFIRHCKRRKKLRLLQDKPWDSISAAIHKPSKKYDVGVDMSSTKLKIQGEQLLNKWLKEKRGVDDNGKEVLTLHHLNSLRLLDELINYDRKKNTDGISSMFLIMFWINQEELVPMKKHNKKDVKSKLDAYFELKQSGPPDAMDVYYEF